jgi:hypothetical protein
MRPMILMSTLDGSEYKKPCERAPNLSQEAEVPDSEGSSRLDDLSTTDTAGADSHPLWCLSLNNPNTL